MKTLIDIKKEKQAKVDTLLTESGVFFAFSNEQFAANKTPLKEGEKYISMGAGGYMPKGKLETYLRGIKEINKYFKNALKQSKELRYQHIAYELANYEAYYTGDIADTLDALGKGYTAKEVWKVYNIEKEKVEF